MNSQIISIKRKHGYKGSKQDIQYREIIKKMSSEAKSLEDDIEFLEKYRFYLSGEENEKTQGIILGSDINNKTDFKPRK